jgi:hypothetical protein
MLRPGVLSCLREGQVCRLCSDGFAAYAGSEAFVVFGSPHTDRGQTARARKVQAFNFVVEETHIQSNAAGELDTSVNFYEVSFGHESTPSLTIYDADCIT